MGVGFIARLGAKITAKIGAKAAARAAAKTAVKGTVRQSLRRFGLGAGVGMIGTMGLSYLGGGALSLSSFNPLSEDFNVLLFGVVAIVLIAFFLKFRR